MGQRSSFLFVKKYLELGRILTEAKEIRLHFLENDTAVTYIIQINKIDAVVYTPL